jgi:hypothetical protein
MGSPLDDFSIREALQFVALLISLFGLWYKLNQDMNTKVDNVRKSTSEDLSDVKHTLNNLRMSVISRQEHDTDIESVKAEVRTFRDEVRDDIRSLSTNLTQRFDTMMQRMFDLKNHSSKD